MNLTKGKISKLYSKKKQSLKRNKNKRSHSGKSKTFRKNKRINLARKSLKRLPFKVNKGGGLNGEDGSVTDAELPKETSDNKPVDDTKAEPSPVVESIFKFPPESSAPVNEVPFETNPAVNQTSLETNPEMGESSSSAPVNEAPFETNPAPVNATVNETPSSESQIVDETPPLSTVDESANNEDPELASAINNVVSLITEKVTKQVNANSSDVAQNGFKEIDDTARIMGSSGGGNKLQPKKSRKFKLTRKNKTR